MDAICSCVKGTQYDRTTDTIETCQVHGDGESRWIGDEFDQGQLAFERLTFVEGERDRLREALTEAWSFLRDLPIERMATKLKKALDATERT